MTRGETMPESIPHTCSRYCRDAAALPEVLIQ
jgi:hypothetical protein